MILCDTEIRAALENRQIVIDPLPTPERIKTTSVDLTLGAEFHQWISVAEAGEEFIVDPGHENFDYRRTATRLTSLMPSDSSGIIIKPGSFVLALTSEKVALPETSRLAARVEGRSSLARLGLAIHLTAPTIHAGFSGKIALEITNHGIYPLRLRPGLPICQLIFEMVFGTPSSSMTGVFQFQDSVHGKT